jgi:hypothetical protein
MNTLPQLFNSRLKSTFIALVVLVPLRQTSHRALESLKACYGCGYGSNTCGWSNAGQGCWRIALVSHFSHLTHVECNRLGFANSANQGTINSSVMADNHHGQKHSQTSAQYLIHLERHVHQLALSLYLQCNGVPRFEVIEHHAERVDRGDRDSIHRPDHITDDQF